MSTQTQAQQLYEVLNAKGKSIATMYLDAAKRRADEIGGTYQPFNPPAHVETPAPFGEVIERNGRFETVTNGFGGTTERKVSASTTTTARRSTGRVSNPGRAPGQPMSDRAKTALANKLTFVRKLLAEREGVEAAEEVRAEMNQVRERGIPFTFEAVDEAITRLLLIPKPGKGNGGGNGRQATPAITEDGFYADDSGTVWKVQESDNGRLYAKKLHPHVCDDTCNEKCRKQGTWEYLPGAVYQLKPEHQLDLERGKQFGKLYGFCCVCGATLRAETSIEAGIGPVCAGKF